jgi:hypothetical protein
VIGVDLISSRASPKVTTRGSNPVFRASAGSGAKAAATAAARMSVRMDMENLEGESWGMSRPLSKSASGRDVIQRMASAPRVPQSCYGPNRRTGERSVPTRQPDDFVEASVYIARLPNSISDAEPCGPCNSDGL